MILSKTIEELKKMKKVLFIASIIIAAFGLMSCENGTSGGSGKLSIIGTFKNDASGRIITFKDSTNFVVQYNNNTSYGTYKLEVQNSSESFEEGIITMTWQNDEPTKNKYYLYPTYIWFEKIPNYGNIGDGRYNKQ
jgi:predicted small secreted protein